LKHTDLTLKGTADCRSPYEAMSLQLLENADEYQHRAEVKPEHSFMS